MIREVYIDNKLIDIESANAAGYIFTSPIFRDISKIVSNRTTTYKIPKTTRNLTIFGLADNPDVNTLAPYRVHTFAEFRDGIPFISGVCHHLKTADKELELAVFWGNSEKLQALKDIKLRDLRFKYEDYQDENGNEIEGYRFVFWNADSTFLTDDSNSNSGFLKVDYGRGVNDMQFIHPCVNVQFILNLIKSSTGVTINYRDKFIDEFTNKWFPLTDKNANSITWNKRGKYYTYGTPAHATTYENQSYSILNFLDSSNDILVNVGTGSHIKAKEDATVEFIVPAFAPLIFKAEDGLQGKYEIKVYLGQGWAGEVYAEEIIKVIETDEGKLAYFSGSLSFNSSQTEDVYIKVATRIVGTDRWRNLKDKFTLVKNESSPRSTLIYVKYDEVSFGDKFPIIPNLPDISVIDFLKSLMSMYGLFTYHNFNNAPDVVEFVSIDEMYDEKAQAYDWTNKLVLTNKGRMNVGYTYGEYARKNNLKYKNDKDITINANGYIELDNDQLPAEKNLIELSYSPSNNTSDEFNNTYAKIPIYDAEGKYSSTGIRILSGGTYISFDESGQKLAILKSASFDESLYFGGANGLVAKRYSKYQAVMLHPVVVDCAVYLSEVELHLFRENNSIYIDGVFYMPITVTVQADGLAVCKLIKMPYLKD